MARSSTSLIRVDAKGLCRALRAAAAFADADKKSHRHRINLRTVNTGNEDDPTMQLLVSGGNALRVIVISAGDLDKHTEEFAADLSVRSAARIVQMFAQTDGVTLKTDGKTIAVVATDGMFDNQEVKVRALKPEARSDALLIASRLHARTKVFTGSENPVASSDLACIAAAGKALGSGVETEDVELGDSEGVRVRFGAGAVAYVRTSGAVTSLAAGWYVGLAVDMEEAWAADHITVGHILDGALPNVTTLKAVNATDEDDDAGESDGDPIDLDDLDDDGDQDTDTGAVIAEAVSA